MKFETINVYGAKELIESMGLENSDSYETHIEDPDTLETAPYAFVIGENDMKEIVSRLMDAQASELDSCVYDARGLLTVTARIKDSSLLMAHELNLHASYDCMNTIVIGPEHSLYLRATYHDLRVIRKHIMDAVIKHNGTISNNMRMFIRWMYTLPYQELLTNDEEVWG